MSGGSKGFRRLAILVGAVCAFFVFIYVFFNFGGNSWALGVFAVFFFLAGGLFTRLGGWVVRGFQEDREAR
jgi:hypothetical protein